MHFLRDVMVVPWDGLLLVEADVSTEDSGMSNISMSKSNKSSPNRESSLRSLTS